MEIRKYLQYIRFISLTRSFLRGEKTRSDILMGLGILIVIRIGIYVIMSFNGAHPMSLLNNI